MDFFPHLLISLLYIFATVKTDTSDPNPYKVLGVPRNANDKQIRNAYRNLAKDWHPDKNKSPDANNKFHQISQAYEILSDQERRSLYDDYGTTSEPRHGAGQHNHHQRQYHQNHQRQSYDDFFRDFDGFESFFGGHQRQQQNHNRKSQEDEISKKIYDDVVLPQSYVKPYIIFSYTEFCFSCMSVDTVWQSFKQEIKTTGFGAGHSDASWNRELAKVLGITTVPSIVGIIDGRIVHFRGGDYTLKNLREFARRLVPPKLVTDISNYDLNTFNQTLDKTLGDNKVFALFIQSKASETSSSEVTLRFKMPCFQLSHFIKCTTLNPKQNTWDKNFLTLIEKFYRIQVKDSKEKLYIFKGPARPALQLTSSQQTLNFNEILDFFNANKFLDLSRLSSSAHFYDLCPTESTSNHAHIVCVIFVTSSTEESATAIFLKSAKFLKEITSKSDNSVQFTYVHHNIQTDFIEKLLKSSRMTLTDNNWRELEKKVFFVKRISEKYAKFNWLDIDPDTSTPEHLLSSIKLASKTLKFEHKFAIPNFYNESSSGFFVAILEYFETLWNYFTDQSFWERLLSNSSYMMILICTFLFIWLIMIFSAENSNPNSVPVPSNGSPRPKAKTGSFTSNNFGSTGLGGQEEVAETAKEDLSFNFNINTANQFELVEMNKYNYANLVEKSPKGYRTVLIILRKENKEHLKMLFTLVASKYLNKSYQLRFAFLNKNTLTAQKWLNEIMFERYKQLGEHSSHHHHKKRQVDSDSESSSSSSNNSDSEYEIYSQDDHKQLYAATDKKVASSSIEFDGDAVVLAINSARKFYYVFNFKWQENQVGGGKSRINNNNCTSLEDNKFIDEFSNWLDKLTEGLDLNKKSVQDWPAFS